MTKRPYSDVLGNKPNEYFLAVHGPEDHELRCSLLKHELELNCYTPMTKSILKKPNVISSTRPCIALKRSYINEREFDIVKSASQKRHVKLSTKIDCADPPKPAKSVNIVKMTRISMSNSYRQYAPVATSYSYDKFAHVFGLEPKFSQSTTQYLNNV